MPNALFLQTWDATDERDAEEWFAPPPPPVWRGRLYDGEIRVWCCSAGRRARRGLYLVDWGWNGVFAPGSVAVDGTRAQAIKRAREIRRNMWPC